MDQSQGSWVDELPDILWAYRTTLRDSAGLTPFHLVYGGEAVVPIEIGCTSARIEAYVDSDTNHIQRAMELDLVVETREQTNRRLQAYRQCMSQVYSKRVIPHSFQVGDFVWKKRKPLGEVGKLEPRWERPYRVTSRLTDGSYYLADPQDKELPRSWHTTHLHLYHA
ncbi:uncharacterized protein LOC141834071 [Curcuma longa]|uniref:uncharacterized protein LOC141834071 n=1 Tax=Curcuma longa TaxID=136217 RepID=UPI003D9FA2E4